MYDTYLLIIHVLCICETCSRAPVCTSESEKEKALSFAHAAPSLSVDSALTFLSIIYIYYGVMRERCAVCEARGIHASHGGGADANAFIMETNSSDAHVIDPHTLRTNVQTVCDRSKFRFFPIFRFRFFGPPGEAGGARRGSL